jgi:hypothetical protein
LNYLDFEWPENANSAETNQDRPLFYQRQYYSAVTALFLIGSPALLPLVHQLENEALPEKARSKAVETIMLSYSEYPPKGVAVIRPSIDKVGKASAEKLRLVVFGWCDLEHRSLCENALHGN